MIEMIFTPLEWYTHFETIELGPTIEAGLDTLVDVGIKGSLWDRELVLVLAACRILGKTTEGAYALLKVAETAARRSFLERARDLVEEAGSCLSCKNDQTSILEWILGSLEWQLRKHTSGYAHWNNARKNYKELIKVSIKEHKRDQTEWYKKCQKKLDALQVDLAFSIAGGYLLLNHFNKSRLTPIPANLVFAIRQELSKKTPTQRNPDDLERIRLKLNLLEKATLFSEEEPEARLVCAQVCIELGEPQDIDKGLEYLQLAEAKYHSDPDNLVVVYWILGAVQWSVDGVSRKPFETWRLCLEKVHALEDRADRSKDIARLEWYRMLGEILELGVGIRLSESPVSSRIYRAPARPADPGQSVDPGDKPKSSPPPVEKAHPAHSEVPETQPEMNSQQTGPVLEDTPFDVGNEVEQAYIELLQMTRGNREQALRLIDLERKKRPGAKRLEWIRSAIQKWRDDNR